MKKIVLLSIFSIVFYGCPNNHINEGCNHSYYIFDIPVTFEPDDSIIHIGDTITVSSFIPREKWDKDSNYIFVLDSINFFIANGFIKLDTLIKDNNHYSFTNDFSFIVDSLYNFRKRNNYIFVDYFYSGEDYYIQYHFVPKKKGIYLFEFASNINLTQSYRYQVITTKNQECKTNRWSPNIMTNGGNNNNKEFLKESPTDFYNIKYYNNWSRYNTIDGAHCFKVE